MMDERTFLQQLFLLQQDIAATPMLDTHAASMRETWARRLSMLLQQRNAAADQSRRPITLIGPPPSGFYWFKADDEREELTIVKITNGHGGQTYVCFPGTDVDFAFHDLKGTFWAVLQQPTPTTFRINLSADISQFVLHLDAVDTLLQHLYEGDNGSTKPDRNFMERTLHEARRIIHHLKQIVRPS